LRAAIAKVAYANRCATAVLNDGFLATLQRMAYRVAGGGRSRTFAPRMVLVLKHPGQGVASPAQLMEAFGMTAAEARLASAIGQGLSLEQYGVEHDVRPGTLRTQLSSVFLKTGVGRQADLVALVHAIPRCEA
jgi:DNA-binding CsgD family transcriptional regulator